MVKCYNGIVVVTARLRRNYNFPHVPVDVSISSVIPPLALIGRGYPSHPTTSTGRELSVLCLERNKHHNDKTENYSIDFLYCHAQSQEDPCCCAGKQSSST